MRRAITFHVGLWSGALVSALQTPNQLRGRNTPTLEQAVLNAMDVPCNDPTSSEPDKSTPGACWVDSTAGDLLAAIALQWGQSDAHEKYPDLSTYVATLAGLDTNNFRCEDISADNDCDTYQPNCVSMIASAHLQAWDHLLSSRNPT
jgi:hypothetical protein